MKYGKLITIEGTDCSGKETQSKLLVKNLKLYNIPTATFGYPVYDSPTGKIVGGPYIGKPAMGKSFFEEGPGNVDYLVSSSYYAADRRYHKNKMEQILKSGKCLILDRYVESNMANQGGKIIDKDKRYQAYKKFETLEYDIMELPKPDGTIFLYMPYEVSLELKKNRLEVLDPLELDQNYLMNAERAYLELSNMYNWDKINCSVNGNPRTIDDISEEIVYKVKKKIL